MELLVIEQKMTTTLTRGLDQQVYAFATTILIVSVNYSFSSKIPNYPFKGIFHFKKKLLVILLSNQAFVNTLNRF